MCDLNRGVNGMNRMLLQSIFLRFTVLSNLA